MKKLVLVLISIVMIFGGCGVKVPEKEVVYDKQKVLIAPPSVLYTVTKDVPEPPGEEYLEASNMKQKSMLANHSIESYKYITYLLEKLSSIKRWTEESVKATED